MTRRQTLWLIGIVIAAVAGRLLYLYAELHAPGFQWDDPDGYLRQAAALTRSGHWRWTRAAVDYRWGGRTWELPPGYPVFLSLFYGTRSPSPLAAAIAQCVIGGLAAAAVFVIGRALHNVRAGLVGAAVWAAWFPVVSSVRTFIQEQLYGPLLCAMFAALAWCLAQEAPLAWFFWTGVLFGITALTRAMPLFFLPLLLPFFLLPRTQWPIGLRRFGALLGGIALPVVPYVVWLSVEVGQLVIIDNHMMILQSGTRDPRSLVAAYGLVVDGLKQLGAIVPLAMGMLKVYGPSWLYHYGAAASAHETWRLALLVHVGFDTLFVLAAILAPLGFALARQRHVSGMLVAWIGFVVASSVALGFSGPRYRFPFEAVLVCASAVIPAGRWRMPNRLIAAGAAAISIVLAIFLAPQYVDSWHASVPYGLNGWTRLMDVGMEQTFGRGDMGFYAPAVHGLVTFEAEAMPDSGPVHLTIKVDGVQAATAPLEPGRPITMRLPAPDRSVAFIEVSPRSAAGSGVAYYIRFAR